MNSQGEDKIITRHKNLVVRLSRKADENILSLLSSTVLGTRGGLRHQLTGVESRIRAYKENIRFVSLYIRGRLAGTVAMCYRKTRTAKKYYHSTYIRYLSFMPLFRTALTGRGKTAAGAEAHREGTWKDRVLAFFRKPHMLDFPGCDENDKHIVYAYVEAMNERSKNLIHQMGFEHIRSFITVPFSRFSPRSSDEVTRLAAEDREEMKKLLLGFYEDHSFFSPEFSFYGDKYYVIKKGGDIIAGLSVIPAALRIVEIPGFKGWVFKKVLPWLPPFNRIIRPGELRFLSLESIYFKEGKVKELEKLIESACAIEGYNTALSWLDEKSPVCELIRSELDMGTLNRMISTAPGLVYAGFVNFDEAEKEYFYRHPAFISGFDFT